MRLKKLKIFGFKSFAEKLSLDFDSEVTAIVGPNGCGKSNIVDAFRWVMGEQSAKSMRGERMGDVLFAGTAKRGPLNFAEVSVTLTGVEKWLQVAYDEVKITRRLHRSGESEYLLNGDSIRLRDLQSLFMGSGIGKNAFSIFEQGKLDQVIHLSPIERRVIFDESAGIGRFLQRKKETIRKLEQVSSNAARLKDIHTEVEKQSRTLKRQANQAKNYKENKDKFETLEQAILKARWERVCDENDGEDQKLLLKIAESQKQLETLRTSLETTTSQLTDQETIIRQKREGFYQAKNTLQLKQAEDKRHHEKLQDLEAKEQKLRAELKRLYQQHQVQLQAIGSKVEKQVAVEKEKVSLEEEVAKNKEFYQQLDDEAHRLREEVKEAQKEHLSAIQNENQLSASLQEKRLRSDNNQERAVQLQDVVEEKKGILQTLKKEQKERKIKVEELSAQIDQMRKAGRTTDLKLTKIQKSVDVTEKELETVRHEMAEVMAREKSLIRLREAFEGFSSGAKELLKCSQNPKSPLHTKIQGLFENLSPKKGEERKVALALRSYAHTLVVKNRSDLDQVIVHAQKQGWNDFSLLCLESLGSCQNHFLKDLKPVATLASAISHVSKSGSQAITKDGYFVDHRQVIFRTDLEKSEGNAFLREAELKEIAQTLREVREKRTRLEKQLEKCITDRKALELQKSAQEEKRRKYEMDLVEENFGLQRILADLVKTEEGIAALGREQQERRALEKELTKAFKTLEKQFHAEKEKRDLLLDRAQKAETKLEKEQQQLKQATVMRQESEERYQRVLSQWQTLGHEIQFFDIQNREIRRQEEQLTQELKRDQETLAAGACLIEKFAAAEKELQTKVEELQAAAEQLELVQEKAKEEKSQLEKTVFEREKRVAELEQKSHLLQLKQAEKSSERRTLEAELKQRFELTMTDLPSRPEEKLEQMQEESRRLRYQIESAGAVNLASIDEYKEHEERAKSLAQQLTDLEGAKKDFEKIISKLEKESRKIFKETFAKIRERFQKNFQILFDGGEADLKFTESPDVLEAGIEIVAKPPGKQLRSISLLSGGEKCLTALGLLFSIFEVKPAPFCILDEVDAPLDDSNIDRFTRIVKQFVDKTQFIIVTHNKKTMAMADILFGVSMEEKGVSKLISLEFERKKEVAPC